MFVMTRIVLSLPLFVRAGQMLLFAAAAVMLQGCRKPLTYGERKKDEKDAIHAWLMKNDYRIISEETFYRQDSLTADDEFVLFRKEGIYMNIVRRGEGQTVLPDGRYHVLSRYVEVTLLGQDGLFRSGDTLTGNMSLTALPTFRMPGWGLQDYLRNPEEYTLTIKGTKYTAKFHNGSLMGFIYRNPAVPAGWLFPLRFVRPVRTSSSADMARVRVIVPHPSGTIKALEYVYPCLYELTYSLW